MKISVCIKYILSVICLFAQTEFVIAQTASLLPNALQQYFDNNGNPLTSGTVQFYIPNTSTPKKIWKDANESSEWTNPITLDAGGKPPGGTGGIYGQGTYRQVVKDANGNLIWDAVTAAGGSGSGSSSTGDGDLVGTIKPWGGVIAPNQYAFAYGQALLRTTYNALFLAITQSLNVICNSSSNTLTGISDTTQIPINAPVESICVPPGTTVVSKTGSTIVVNNPATISINTTAVFFPFGNGDGSTTFNLPDLRGYVIAGRPNMGGSDPGRLTATYFGTNPDAQGAVGGSQSKALITGNLPPYTPAGSVTVNSNTTGITASTGSSYLTGGSATSGSGASPISTSSAVTITDPGHTHTASFTGTAQGGASTAFSIIQPTQTLNYIIKITPDTNSAIATGVTSLGGMVGDIACGIGILCTGNIISVSGIPSLTGDNSWTGKNTFFNNVMFGAADPWCDPRSQGAQGNSSNDDGPAFAACITILQASPTSGGIIYVPPGSYCLKSNHFIDLPTRVSIVGTGSGSSSVIQICDNSDMPVIKVEGRSIIKNIILYGLNSSSATFPTLWLTSNAIDAHIENVDTNFGKYCIRNDGADNILIHVNGQLCFGSANFYNTGLVFLYDGKFDQGTPLGDLYTAIPSAWQANTAYNVHDLVLVGGNLVFQATSVIGDKKSGSVFPTSPYGYITSYVDNNVTWKLATPWPYYGMQFDTAINGVTESHIFKIDTSGAYTCGIASTNTGAGTAQNNIKIEGAIAVGIDAICLTAGRDFMISHSEISTSGTAGSGVITSASWVSGLSLVGNTFNGGANSVTLTTGVNTSSSSNLFHNATTAVNITSNVSSWSFVGDTVSAISNCLVVGSGITDYGIFNENCNGSTVTNGGTGIHNQIVADGYASKFGRAVIGTWPANTTTAIFGNSTLDQTAAGNYAIIQDNTGVTSLNSSTGNIINFRINNVDKWHIGTNGGLYTHGATGGDLGANTLNVGSSVEAQALLYFTGRIDVTISADQNNWSPTGFSSASAVFVDGGASDRNITGLVGGSEGRFVWLVNKGTTNSIILKNQSGSSTAANQFLLPSDTTLTANTALALRYDGTASVWRPSSRALSNTGVTAGSYGGNGKYTTLTVDVSGRLSAAGDGTLTTVNGVTYPASYTSGGIPYASSTSAISSSGLLAANQLVLGGGAATTPATLGSLGTTTTVLHGNASGAPSFANVSTSDFGTNKVGLANGGTNADLSGTGGTSQVLKQISSGAAITVGQLATTDLSNTTASTTYVPTDVSGGGLTFAAGTTAEYTIVGNICIVQYRLIWPSTADTHNALISSPCTSHFTNNGSVAYQAFNLTNASNFWASNIGNNAAIYSSVVSGGSQTTNATLSGVELRIVVIFI